MTVKELLQACEKQVAKWNGDRIIFISNDEDWNGWHEIINHFVSNPEIIKDYDEYEEVKNRYNYDEVVLLW
jgi:hypothetical protein